MFLLGDDAIEERVQLAALTHRPSHHICLLRPLIGRVLRIFGVSTAGLQSLRGMWQTSWNLVCAASIIAALPPVALFFLMQRQLIAGLTYGARAE